MNENGSIQQKTIAGDVDDLDKDFSEFDQSISLPISWNDINAHVVVLPEYDEEALRQIEFQLGYLPPRTVTLPDEPFIRYALYEYDFQHNDFDRLCDECNPHIQNIYMRNLSFKA